MAEVANVVTIGPFTTFVGAVINLINSAMRVRTPYPEPLNITNNQAAGGGEVSSVF